jgi:hypothetical protein
LEPRQLLTQVAGAISQDTVWRLADSPLEVTGDVTVQPGATLQIEPGAVVQFRANTGLTVRGRLLAEGTPDDRMFPVAVHGTGSCWKLRWRTTGSATSIWREAPHKGILLISIERA